MAALPPSFYPSIIFALWAMKHIIICLPLLFSWPRFYSALILSPSPILRLLKERLSKLTFQHSGWCSDRNMGAVLCLEHWIAHPRKKKMTENVWNTLLSWHWFRPQRAFCLQFQNLIAWLCATTTTTTTRTSAVNSELTRRNSELFQLENTADLLREREQ